MLSGNASSLAASIPQPRPQPALAEGIRFHHLLRWRARRERKAICANTEPANLDNSTSTTNSSPPDQKLVCLFTGSSTCKNAFLEQPSKRHFPDIPISPVAEERLRNWRWLYQKKLDDLLEDYKGQGKAKIQDENLEFWGTCREDAQLYLVFRWAEGPGWKEKLIELLEKDGASRNAEGCFLFMVEVMVELKMGRRVMVEVKKGRMKVWMTWTRLFREN